MSQPTKDKGVSKLARELGVSVSLVSRKMLQGKSEADIRSEAELYRAEQAEHEAEETGDDESYQQARARKERAVANLREIDVSLKEGKLIERTQVETDAFKTARIIRDGLQAIPDRVAALLAAESDPARVHTLLSAEIRTVLETLSDRVAEVADESV